MTSLKGLLLAIAALLGLPGIAAAQELTEITIIQPTIRSMIVWPIHIGEMLGYFEDEGISLNLIASDATIPYVLFLSGGNADLVMLEGAEALHAATAGFDIAGVYSVHQRVSQGIFVEERSPLYSPAELIGRTVGLASDRDHLALRIAMAHARSGADGVGTIVVGESGPVLASVFLNGGADAFIGSVTAVAALKARGIDLRDITAGPSQATTSTVYAMLGSRIDELRGPLCGFFRAWSKAIYIGQQDIEIIAAMTRHPDGVPEQWESGAFGYQYLYAVADMLIPRTERFGEIEPEIWTAIQADMIEVGEISRPVELATMLSDRFIGCANDFDKGAVLRDAKAWMAEPANADYVHPAD